MPVFHQEQRLILYEPHYKQLEIHISRKRFRIAAWGRQSGKSTCALNEIVKQAWENPRTKYWYVSPTHSQAQDQYRRLVGMLWACRGVLIKKNQTELRIVLSNRSEIKFVSGESGTNLRGATLNGVVLDEVRDLPPDLWHMVIRPMLATTRGWALFISTPNGFDSFYDLFELAKVDSEWDTFQVPSNASPYFSQEEFDAQKRTLPEPIFAQELLAEFRDITSGRAYTTVGPHNERLDSPFAPGRAYSPHLPIYVSCDFNLSPMAWLLGQTSQGHVHVPEEVYVERCDDPYEALRELAARLDRIPFDVNDVGLLITGDATGKAKQRTSHKSDYDIIVQFLRERGYKARVIAPESNPGIFDRVTTVNTRCKNASGIVTFTYNPIDAPFLKKDAYRVVWKNGIARELDPGPQRMQTHPTDALGYFICTVAPLKIGGKAGKVRIINRSF